MKKIYILAILLVTTCLYSQPLTGNKYIPGDYSTIASAITALNTNGVGTGGVRFNISADYTETFDLNTRGLITATGTSGNPIVFIKYSSGANPLITGATGTGSSDYIIKIEGGDYITFDGIDLRENPSNSTSTTYNEYGYFIANPNGANGCQYDTIRNCRVVLNRSNTNSSKCVYQYNYYSTVSSNAGRNAFNVYCNLSLENCSREGIYLFARSRNWPDSANQIFNCIIGASYPVTDIGSGNTVSGIRIDTCHTSVMVYNNTVRNIYTSSTSDIYGIFLNRVRGINYVFNNHVYSIRNTNTNTGTPWYLFGIRVEVRDSHTAYIYNNVIHSLFHSGVLETSNVMLIGMGVNTLQSGTVYVYHNSICVDQPGGKISSIVFWCQGGTLRTKNNIFANLSDTGTATQSYSRRYCYFFYNAVMDSSDNNDLYIKQTYGYRNVIGYYTTERKTLSDWISATEKDSNSTDVNPGFFSSSDLHTLNSSINGAGVRIITPDIDKDIEGHTRNAITPDIGAYEFETSSIINVTATSGTLSADYSSLKDAFAQINSGLHRGNITVYIKYHVSDSGAVLNASGTKSADYTNVRIVPYDSALKILSCSSSNPLIRLDGADNVTIDGRYNGSGKLFELVNPSSNSVIELLNDATGDSIMYCTIKGKTSLANRGLVSILSGSTTGNDRTVISNCTLTNASDTTTPYIGIYAKSLSGVNDSIQIINNEIYNFVNKNNSGISAAMYLDTNTGTGIKIVGNNIYSQRYSTGTSTFGYAIFINDTTNCKAPEITSNYIGGNGNYCSGVWNWSVVNFYALYMNLSTLASASVQNNKFRNIRNFNNFNGALNLNNGSANIGTIEGNTFDSLWVAGGSIRAIVLNGNGTIDVANNSITKLSQSTNYTIQGIYSNTTNKSDLTIRNNTIYNFISPTYATTLYAMCGIYITNGDKISITGNTIYNLKNTYSASNTNKANVTGIYSDAVSDTKYKEINKNNIYGLDLTGTRNDTSSVNGIYTGSGKYSICNNSVSLGTGTPVPVIIRGIYKNSTAADSIYFNSVYIGGTADSQKAYTTAFYKSASPSSGKNYVMNNIFANFRTGSLVDPAMIMNNLTNCMSNYNAFHKVSIIAGICCLGTPYPSAWFEPSAWQSGNPEHPDMNSIFYANPGYTSSTNLLPDESSPYCWNLNGMGTPVARISYDINGNPRSTSISTGAPDMGAYEFTPSSTPQIIPQYDTIGNHRWTQYTLNYQNICHIYWNTGTGTLPDSVHVYFYPGAAPPDLTSGTKYGFNFWYIKPFGGSPGYYYDIKFFYDSARTYQILNPNQNIILAKYDSTTRVWVPYQKGSESVAGYCTVDTNNKTVTAYNLDGFSAFTMTDKTNPLNRLLLGYKAYIAGYYDASADSMLAAFKDTVHIVLRSGYSPYNVIDSGSSPIDNQGYCSILTTIPVTDTNYYLVFRHRNSLETWSKYTFAFSRINGTLKYRWIDSSGAAYGDNLKLLGTKYCIINGDVNKDNWIDGSDYLDIFNNYDTGGEGLTPDTNGDAWIDGSDYLAVFNNYDVGAITPFTMFFKNKKSTIKTLINFKTKR